MSDPYGGTLGAYNRLLRQCQADADHPVVAIVVDGAGKQKVSTILLSPDGDANDVAVITAGAALNAHLDSLTVGYSLEVGTNRETGAPGVRVHVEEDDTPEND